MDDAIIGLIGGIIGAVVTLLLGLLTRKFNYHQLFAQTVSHNRMDWINVWRENISTFLACAKILRKMSYCTNRKSISNDSSCDCFEENYFKFEKSRSMITTRLNLTEDNHVLMFSAINQLDYTEQDDTEFNSKCALIEEIARSILKPEWERLKEEAKGKKS